MLNRKEVLDSPNYLETTYNLEIRRLLWLYMDERKLTRKDVAAKIDVEVSQIDDVLNGESTFSLRGLISLGLMLNKVLSLEFLEYEAYWNRVTYKESLEKSPPLVCKNTEEFERFKTLTDEWAKAVGGHSVIHNMAKHKNHQIILDTYTNKDDLLGYVCLMIDKHFFLATILLDDLKIEGPPMDDYYAGRIAVMLECWRYWALHEKILTTKYDMTGYWPEDKHGNHNRDWKPKYG